MADLALLQTEGLERAVPEVKTLARPVSGPLIAARHEVQHNPRLKALFAQAREQKWAADKLTEAIAPELVARLTASPEEVTHVARYLADEYEQIGTAILVCSTTTGKAFAHIEEQDFIQPNPVPRESGGLANPLPRLRPDLHGFLVQWVFDEEREKKLTEALALRSHQTELQRQEGDWRLLPITRAGRAELTRHLRENLPTLLRAAQGIPRAFLDHFDFLPEAPSEGSSLWPMLSCSATYCIVSSIADVKSFNLRFDRLASMGAQISSGWVRDIATTLAEQAEEYASVQAVLEWPRGDFPRDIFAFPADMWVGTSDFTSALTSSGDRTPWMAVDGIQTMGLQGKVGAIILKGYDCKSREIFDRWETIARVEYELWVDWSRVASFTFLNQPVPEVIAEVVR